MLKSGASYIAFAVSNKVGDAPGVGHDRQRGVGPVAVGNGPPSTTNKFATSWAWHHLFSTEVSGSLPIRVVPCWCEQLPVMRSG
jgi:hypothetical protein